MTISASLLESVSASIELFDALHTGIAIFDKDGKFFYANAAFERMYGIRRRDYLSQPAQMYFVTAEQGVKRVLETRQQNACMATTVNGLHGLVYRYPILDAAGEAVGCLCEFLSVDFDRDRLLEIQKMLERKSTGRTTAITKPGEQYSLATFDDIVGECPAMRELKEAGRRFGKTNEPVLILGENGTGKDLIAQAIHTASVRAAGKFIAINCAAIPSELLESELFGYESGAFTGSKSTGMKGKFEVAAGGTIFLDEIGEVPLGVQSKLLRVLENKEIQKIGREHPLRVDFRLVAASNRNLEEMIEQGLFREDLFQRLNIFELSIPPLRERREDIPLLCHLFIQQQVGPKRASSLHIAQDVLSLFKANEWRGNVRELKNILTFALHAMVDDEFVLKKEHLPNRFFRKREKGTSGATTPHPSARQSMTEAFLTDVTAQAEKKRILEALHVCAGNRSEAAKQLGISRSKLYNRLQRYGLLKKGCVTVND